MSALRGREDADDGQAMIAGDAWPAHGCEHGVTLTAELLEALKGAIMGLEVLAPSASPFVAHAIDGTIVNAKALIARIEGDS